MSELAKADSGVTCDLLLFLAVQSEEEQLRKVAAEMQIPFVQRNGKQATYYDLGVLGTQRVMAVRSRMGPLGYGGSASKALECQAETEATGIIGVGMAFGISDKQQNFGDVLVSTGVFPYDDRDVIPENGGFTYHYPDGRAKFRPSKTSLLNFFEKNYKTNPEIRVQFGALLSGGARIHCAAYRDSLCKHFDQRGQTIVGGEMEAVGFLSCSDPKAPLWIVVKGICDFADEQRGAVFEETRPQACYNAARFVLSSLHNSALADQV